MIHWLIKMVEIHKALTTPQKVWPQVSTYLHEHVVLVVLYPTQNSLFPIQKEVVANGPKKKKQKPSKTGSKRAERSVTPPSGENPFLG